eukprot:UN01284
MVSSIIFHILERYSSSLSYYFFHSYSQVFIILFIYHLSSFNT